MSAKEIKEAITDQARLFSMEVQIGKTAAGDSIIVDLTQSSPLIISGCCGSGKTILLRSLLKQLLKQNTASRIKVCSAYFDNSLDELRDIIGHNSGQCIDCPISENDTSFFQMLHDELHRRFRLFTDAQQFSFSEYNKNNLEPLPYLIVVFDNMDRLFRTPSGLDRHEFISEIIRMWKHFGMILLFTVQTLSILNYPVPREFVNASAHCVFRSFGQDAMMPFLKEEQLSQINNLQVGECLFFSKTTAPVFVKVPYEYATSD